MQKILILENNILATNTIRKSLVTALIQEGNDVIIVSTGTPEEIQMARLNGFTIIDIQSSTQNPISIFRYILALLDIMRTLKPDICLTFTIRPAIWGNIATRLLKIPTITNITGVGPLFSSNQLAYKAARWLYKIVLKTTHTIFFQNQDDYTLFVQNGFVKKQHVDLIPGSGIDYAYFSPMVKTEPSPVFTFLFIGRLLYDKGIREFVAASSILKDEGVHSKSVVVGSLWNQNLQKNTLTQQTLDEWIRDNIITYAGYAADVRKEIANADCIVLPSYREGNSNVLLEASSMEKPCITCDTTGCREIVEDQVTGLLCKVADADDLAQKMKAMINMSPEKRHQMGLDARKKVMRQFDKKIVIHKYLEAIKNIKTKS